MALKHYVSFTVLGSAIDGRHVIEHFRRLGFELVEDSANEWRFHRGSKLSFLWRFDIRAYSTDLVVRCGRESETRVCVSCDFEVWTFMNFITQGDIALLEAEARELQSVLRQQYEPDAEPERDPDTSFRSEPEGQRPGS